MAKFCRPMHRHEKLLQKLENFMHENGIEVFVFGNCANSICVKITDKETGDTAKYVLKDLELNHSFVETLPRTLESEVLVVIDD